MTLALETAEQIPAAIDVEKSLLGGILLNSDLYPEAAGRLRAEDFFLESHQRIFVRMGELAERDGKFDLVTLSQYMSDATKDLASCGGVAYLADLDQTLGMRAWNINAENYCRIIRDKAVSRAVLSCCEALRAMAWDRSEAGLEIVAKGITALTQIAENGQMAADLFSADELADDAEYRLLDNPDPLPILTTGIPKLDEQTGGGMMLGELWVIGASPSRGKTTLARQIVKANVVNGIPAYVHSGEMSKESWFDVTACLLAEMPAWKVYEPRLFNLSEKERLRAAIRELRAMPLRISDNAGITLDRLIWNATREKRRRGIKLMAVDYAQIINSPGDDLRAQVTAVAQRLRRFAKDEQVAVLLLSQSPRPEGRNINARPTMFSLKESGALEEAAHTVLLPYRPVDPESGQFTEQDELIIGKQRRGPIGKVDVRLNGQYLKFEER